ncbi:MAG: DNA alkylation repair protein [Candidatus Moranbacteria bacterium]|nr:DNA alkylation repair protein [Candidatus Moranbacteria bacterium]
MIRKNVRSTTVLNRLRERASSEKAQVLSGFFKTGEGQYGEGDIFLGVTVPEIRKISKEFFDLPFPEVSKLLASRYHEARMAGLLILTYAYAKADEDRRTAIFDFLLSRRVAMNNWDLVDVIAPKTIGVYLTKRKKERNILYTLAESDNLWERRIAIVSTFSFIREGDFSDTLAIAEMFLDDRHDLIHKAAGWMLREVGKRDISVLRTFLDAHASRMPRTMLRYAIERLPDWERKRRMAGRRVL